LGKGIMRERRKYKRFKVDGKGIESKVVFAKNVKIIDMSIGGMSVETDKRLNPGSKHILKLKQKNKVLSLKSIVARCLLGRSLKSLSGEVIPIYNAGLEFIDVPNEMRSEIAKFIEDHREEPDKKVDIYESSGRRLYIRFQIVTPEEVTDFFESCKVKELSLGGILIESEHAQEIENKLQMEIFLPEGEPITLLGRIASCLLIKDEDPKLYDLGIEFLEMSEEDRERLEEFIYHIDESPI
jgi:c-di-GMP-binding flagellar brake protein YcgR